MATCYDRLPEPQVRLLPILAPLKKLHFVLYGGTAIALRLGHRQSIDFDFFTDRAMDREAMSASVPALRNAATLQDEKNTWTVHLAGRDGDRPVKVSFFANLGFGRVGHPTPDDHGHLQMASLDDLLGHKLKVLLQRVEAKDYQDIAAMLSAGQTLERGLGAAEALFPNLPPAEALKALVYFKDDGLDDICPADRMILIAHTDRFQATTPMQIISHHLDDVGPHE
jgi:hypothetical protein